MVRGAKKGLRQKCVLLPKVLFRRRASLTVNSAKMFPTSRHSFRWSTTEAMLANGFSSCSPMMARMFQSPLLFLGGNEGSKFMAARIPRAPAPIPPLSVQSTSCSTRATLRLVPVRKRRLTSRSRLKRSPYRWKAELMMIPCWFK